MQTRARLIAVLLGLGIVLSAAVYLAAETLWFQELGYLSVFWLRLKTQAVIWAIATSVSGLFLLGNLAIARRLSYPNYQKLEAQTQFRSLDFSTPLSLRWLLPVIAALTLCLGVLLLHYAQAAISVWSDLLQTDTSLMLPDRLRPESIWQLGKQFSTVQFQLVYLELGVLIIGAIALLIYPTTTLNAAAVALSLGLGSVLSTQWGRILLSAHAVNFNRTDPLFLQDIGFYIFSLPIGELLEFWLVGLLGFALFAVVLIYLLSGDSLSQGIFIGFSYLQRRHLYALGGCFLLAVSLSYWLSRYELLYSTRGVTYGASYTDVRVQLPVCVLLSVLSGTIALWLLGKALLGEPNSNLQRAKRQLPSKQSQVNSRQRGFGTPLVLGSFLLLAFGMTYILPLVVQHLVVQPSELAREQPFIRRSIALTREAFDLETIDIETFDPRQNLTLNDIQENNLTVRNIRLWDTRPLLETNRQLQQIRPYYRFFDADIDRYTLAPAEERGAIDQPQAVRNREAQGQTTQQLDDAAVAIAQTPEKQQVLISARELDYSAVPPEAKTWVNEHLVYTHGYGYTLSPVNRVGPGGLPDYFVKDIGTSSISSDGALTATDERIRASIPTKNPRIYYGEGTNSYVMTNTRVQELDYPSGSDNVYNIYDGAGGIGIGANWQRWLFAAYLKDWQMVLTNNFTPQTKLLLRRNINQRIRSIAPFLKYDQDPYLVVADIGQNGIGKEEGNRSPNYLYWMIDAYTTSDRYPYSEPASLTTKTAQTPTKERLNYIRNSVKVVVDAYSGAVNFYIAEANDPIIQAWSAIFPSLFKPLSAMPNALQNHIRYPEDLFSIQAERLMTYHMTDPQVFYNREDKWQVPAEIYGNQPQLVEPYYLIMKLPTAKAEEFILLLPFTPNQRTNLTAWIASRSDGTNYGKSLLYLFPKQQLIYGTEQIEARINQDPIISQQISLWNRQGSRALQGNLLVIPIEQSLLYVEPLYLEAEQNSLPTLVRVIVAYENRIAMAETLEQALQAVFKSEKSKAPAIVRPVE